MHKAHLYVALRVQLIFKLDCVLFMIAHVPPHKREVTSAFHRFSMVALALLFHDDLVPCAWELERGGPSFTIDTLEHFAHNHSENQYCFIAGSDSLKEIHLWKDYVKLLENHSFIFVQRLGREVELNELKVPDPLRNRIKPLRARARPIIESGRSFLIDLNAPDISSTSIRKLIAGGQHPPDLVPSRVLQYIQKHKLYGQEQYQGSY